MQRTDTSSAGGATLIQSDPSPGRPEALGEQLRWVHKMLRRDLAAVHDLAGRVADGDIARVRADLQGLQANAPLFRLRTTCLAVCGTLHSHHGGEDDTLFPAIRRAAPHLAALLDRLAADHTLISELLDQIETLAADLDQAVSRSALIDALDTLAAHLADHFIAEEDGLVPLLNTWPAWPDPKPI